MIISMIAHILKFLIMYSTYTYICGTWITNTSKVNHKNSTFIAIHFNSISCVFHDDVLWCTGSNNYMYWIQSHLFAFAKAGWWSSILSESIYLGEVREVIWSYLFSSGTTWACTLSLQSLLILMEFPQLTVVPKTGKYRKLLIEMFKIKSN